MQCALSVWFCIYIVINSLLFRSTVYASAPSHADIRCVTISQHSQEVQLNKTLSSHLDSHQHLVYGRRLCTSGEKQIHYRFCVEEKLARLDACSKCLDIPGNPKHTTDGTCTPLSIYEHAQHAHTNPYWHK